MLTIPLQPVPAQIVKAIVGGQICQVNVYQKFYGLFMDLYGNESLIIGGVICQNLNRIVRSRYLGFTGDFCFIDSQGSEDPHYTGLGGRFSLNYLTVDDVVARGLLPGS